MSAPTFLERAAALDLDMRHLDIRLLSAYANPAVHPKWCVRLLARRDALTREWSQLWNAKPVERRVAPRP